MAEKLNYFVFYVGCNKNSPVLLFSSNDFNLIMDSTNSIINNDISTYQISNSDSDSDSDSDSHNNIKFDLYQQIQKYSEIKISLSQEDALALTKYVQQYCNIICPCFVDLIFIKNESKVIEYFKLFNLINDHIV